MPLSLYHNDENISIYHKEFKAIKDEKRLLLAQIHGQRATRKSFHPPYSASQVIRHLQCEKERCYK